MKRKPRIEYYWALQDMTAGGSGRTEPRVNVRIFAANGLQVGQITQGSKDKRDARRCVNALCNALGINVEEDEGFDYVSAMVKEGFLREVGPGPRPK